VKEKRHRYREAFERLYEIAEARGGYFTTKQAVSAGFSEKNHGYHVRSGNWVREHRGIYRLAKFPNADRPDLILWQLWSRGRDDKPQGVYSHDTALSLYELSDVNPSKLHMTVPPTFRRSSSLPKILRLYRGTIHKEDVETRLGVKVTRPLKTISDLLGQRTIQKDHLQQAVREAFKRGLITRAQLERVSPAVRKEIELLRGAQ
jgi:predicted transcriptional regulator of viral defense system